MQHFENNAITITQTNQNGKNEVVLVYPNGNKIAKLLTQPPFQAPVFIGREEELKTVHDRLFAGENFLMLVNGQGGIGKTTFAAKYWDRYQHEYSHLAFLFVGDFSDTSQVSDKYSPIANALLSLSRTLGLEFTTETQEEQLEILVATVSNLQKPCLLILDNANAEKDLNDHLVLLRRCTNFHILLTSRLADFVYAQKYPLGTLDKKHATALFQKHYPLLQEAEIPLFEEIYEAVGGNTLVLELLAKNLANLNNPLKKRYTLAQLKDDLQKGLTKLSQSKEVNTAYQAKGTGLRYETPEAIILAMYDLSDLSEAETALLSNFAVLPAENIKYEILKLFKPNTFTIFQKPNFFQKLLKIQPKKKEIFTEETFEDVVESLTQKGWIEYNEAEASFKASPVVQEITRHKNQDRLFADCGKMIDFLIEELKRDNIHKENYKYSTLYSRYAESIVNYFEPHSNIILLLERTGVFYTTTGNLQKALDLFEKYKLVAEKLCESEPKNADNKNLLAISYQYLGDTHSSLGNLDKALDFFERYNQLEKALFEAYPNNVGFKNGLAISYSKLGDTHSSLGNLDKALDFFEKDIELSKALSEAYPNNVEFKNGLAISYSKLGDTHSSLGNLDKALEFFERYNQLEKALYEAYPNNVEFKNNLAISYQYLGKTHTSLGNLDKALDLFEKDIELSKALYEAYPNNVEFKNGLAISYSKLGDTHSSLGNLDKALEFFEIETKLFEALYKAYPNNVNFKNGLAISYQYLGNTHTSLGNLDKALEFFEKFKDLEKALSEAYPNNVGFKNSLAISYSKLGDFYKHSDKEKAKIYYLECKKHYVELTNTSSAYVEFQQNLQWAESRLRELG
jgi:tetratricopeptide (TPR) repeat protein